MGESQTMKNGKSRTKDEKLLKVFQLLRKLLFYIIMCVCVCTELWSTFMKILFFCIHQLDNTSGRCPCLAKVVNIINTLLFLSQTLWV